MRFLILQPGNNLNIKVYLKQRLAYFFRKVMVRDGPLNFHFLSHFNR